MTSRMEFSSPKITPALLSRKAVVYVRQSSPGQVRQHTESQRLQYALADRARALGWQRVEVIDIDLGASAALGAAAREGFERLVAAVALGEVGIVLVRELSRLARTHRDWCHLFEVCQLLGTLIGDEEQVYDLNLLDDQLVLGIKGTMSVVELKVLKLRLLQGQEEKARRGELNKLLPPGYVRDALGRVVQDPDQRVREAIARVFRKFRELWSIRQTFKWFRDEGLELPVNQPRGARIEVVWQLPTYSFVQQVLRNPFYAGAYVYGRRTRQMRLAGDRVVRRTSRYHEPEECRVFLRDHHPGYVDWPIFLENRRIIRGNGWQGEHDEAVTAVRSGQGLLVGLLRCGRCGRRLHVRYWGKHGTASRYLCRGDFDAGGRYCLAFGGSTVDRRLGSEVLKVLAPLGVEASLEAIAHWGSEADERRQALARQLEQMEYEAQRAFEQYDAVDARQRLVAAELERRWNARLEEVEQLRTNLQRIELQAPPLAQAERQAILALGTRFTAVWENRRCPSELKKKLLRTLIHEIVVDLEDATGMIGLVIHWQGGTHTRIEMEKPRCGSVQKTSLGDLELIRRMAVRYGDDAIARVLNKLGRRTGKDRRWNETRVHTARRNHAIPGQKRAQPDAEILSMGQAARHSHVSQTTITRLVTSGLLAMEQIAPFAPWEIRRSDLESEPVQRIVERLRRTGKLVLAGVHSDEQTTLFQ